MELANKMVNGDRRSISAILYDSLVKLLEAKHQGDGQVLEIKPLKTEETSGIPVEHNAFEEIPATEPEMEIAPQREPFLPMAIRPKTVKTDPILSNYGRYIERAARLTDLDPALIISVIKVESNGNPRAVSSAGAKGLMQLIDSTAADYGVREVFDPEQNIEAGSRYLKAQLERFGSLRLALAAYNAGPENVKKHGGVPPFKETQAYVEKVIDTLGMVSRIGPNATIKGLK
ncbi:MAG: lytic transglycosylase domain-containing protein [Candidatus Zixiibacteriota bacterium]|nr:MAG: lytic transglycosylase domain-containing protein [candidate division Zixibacteria bacterium]